MARACFFLIIISSRASRSLSASEWLELIRIISESLVRKGYREHSPIFPGQVRRLLDIFAGAASSRNGGRDHPGIAGGFLPESAP
jgi:hypothetical protein